MTDQKTEQKPADHKAIREAARVGGDYTMVEVPDLRALLADLDAMRADAQRYRYLRDVAWGDGSLVYFDHRYDKDEWDGKIDAALAALTAAKAGGWVAVPVEPTPEMLNAGMTGLFDRKHPRATWEYCIAEMFAAMLAARPLTAPPAQKENT